MRLWLEVWRKDNEEQYYGLSKDEVNQILYRYEDAIDEIEELRKALEYISDSDNCFENLPDYAKKALGKEKTS